MTKQHQITVASSNHANNCQCQLFLTVQFGPKTLEQLQSHIPDFSNMEYLQMYVNDFFLETIYKTPQSNYNFKINYQTSSHLSSIANI